MMEEEDNELMALEEGLERGTQRHLLLLKSRSEYLCEKQRKENAARKDLSQLRSKLHQLQQKKCQLEQQVLAHKALTAHHKASTTVLHRLRQQRHHTSSKKGSAPILHSLKKQHRKQRSHLPPSSSREQKPFDAALMRQEQRRREQRMLTEAFSFAGFSVARVPPTLLQQTQLPSSCSSSSSALLHFTVHTFFRGVEMENYYIWVLLKEEKEEEGEEQSEEEEREAEGGKMISLFRHTLPSFVPMRELEARYLQQQDLRSFLREARRYVDALVSRREQFLLLKERWTQRKHTTAEREKEKEKEREREAERIEDFEEELVAIPPAFDAVTITCKYRGKRIQTHLTYDLTSTLPTKVAVTALSPSSSQPQNRSETEDILSRGSAMLQQQLLSSAQHEFRSKPLADAFFSVFSS